MKKHIVHLGITGFPFGTAAVHLCIYIGRALTDVGYKVLFMNNFAVHDYNNVKFNKEDKIDNIFDLRFSYTTFSQYRNKNFFIRNIDKLFGKISEFTQLIVLKIKNELDYVIIYHPTNSFVYLFGTISSRI